ncbi:MAG: hypothetical protein DHS20C11_21280 [Lysobacteraceae bacterium]|nr:MAG: hypothetical protein DHS20C11_21280 [Xanthomonadaceae bacterium]
MHPDEGEIVDPTRYQLIKGIVMQALETPSGELADYLDEACAGDPELRQEVDQLLDLDVGQSFLANSPITLGADLATDIEEPLVGRVGRIRIDTLMARGGMGEVYSGVDDLLKRPVAIKIMTAGLRMSAVRRSAFLNEARVLSSLRHPNICQVYDFFEDRERDVLVLELIEGKTLREILKEGRPENPLQIARQIVHALVAAHERGIIHRDLKPENVMLTPDGEAKVLDFGLARAESSPVSDESGANANLPAAASQISGTPGYMSPEQARGNASTTATDLWSFGLLLGELLTGKSLHPADANTPTLIDFDRVGRVEVPKALPAAERALLRELLSEEPSARPTARDCLDRIDHILNRPRRRWLTAVAALSIAMVLLVGWKYTSDLKREREVAVVASERADQARAQAENLIGFMLDDLNSGLRKVGRLGLLESVADQVLKYYGELSAEDMSRSNGQPAIALQRIAEVTDEQGDLPHAIDIMRRSIAGLDYLIDAEPDNDLALFRLGEAHTYMGDLMRTNGDFIEARFHTESAMTIGEQLTRGFEPGKGPVQRPNGTDRWRVLLRSTYIHADTFMRVGENERTVEFLERAAALAVPAVENEPALTSQLADIQYKRCDTYYDMKADQLALGACRASLEMDRQLHEANPDDYWAHKNFALDHMVTARVYRSLGRADEGLALLEAGAVHTRALLAWEPENATRQNDHVTMLVTKGQLLKSLGQTEASDAIFEDVYTRVLALGEQRDDIPFLNNAFLARLYVGQIEEARAVARILAERGFKRREFREMCMQFEIHECGLTSG